MNVKETLEQLSEPFPPEKVSLRQGGGGKFLAYLNARDVMQRLDDVVGPTFWSDSYEETPSGRVMCCIDIMIHDSKGGRWVSKCDGAGDTTIEGAKGAISDAFKRAAVKWGIGRYLYDLPVFNSKEDGKRILRNYVPADTGRLVAHNLKWREYENAIVSIRGHCYGGNLQAAWEEWNEIPDDDRMILKVAPTKGGWMDKVVKDGLAQAAKDDFDPDAGVYRSIAERNAK